MFFYQEQSFLKKILTEILALDKTDFNYFKK